MFSYHGDYFRIKYIVKPISINPIIIIKITPVISFNNSNFSLLLDIKKPIINKVKSINPIINLEFKINFKNISYAIFFKFITNSLNTPPQKKITSTHFYIQLY